MPQYEIEYTETDGRKLTFDLINKFNLRFAMNKNVKLVLFLHEIIFL